VVFASDAAANARKSVQKLAENFAAEQRLFRELSNGVEAARRRLHILRVEIESGGISQAKLDDNWQNAPSRKSASVSEGGVQIPTLGSSGGLQSHRVASPKRNTRNTSRRRHSFSPSKHNNVVSAERGGDDDAGCVMTTISDVDEQAEAVLLKAEETVAAALDRAGTDSCQTCNLSG